MRAGANHARLLAATAISLALTTPSRAAVNGLESGDSNPVANPAGTTITGDRKGVYSYGPALNLDNAGTIRGNGTAGSVNDSDGGIIFNGGPGTITNSGSISGARFGISTIYFNNAGTFEGRAIGSTVNNSGSIIGDSDDGVRLIGGGSVINSGLISGRVGVGADGISMFAYNGQNTAGMTTIGSVTNLAGGVIDGKRWAIVLFGGGGIDNAGTINGPVMIQSSPLLGAGQTGTITNSGTMNFGGINLGPLDTASVNNSGTTTLVGYAGVTNANLTNSGTIQYFASFNTVGTANVNNSGSIGEGLILTKTTTANVTNSGSIVATNTPDVVGTTRDAVYSQANLSLTNTAAGSINGYVSGIRSEGVSLALDNAGTIRGNGTTAGFTATNGGISISGGPASITNSGSISGARYGITTTYFKNPDGSVVGKAIGSTISNSGSIIGDNDDGIRLIGGGAVTNSGHIFGRENGDTFGLADPPHADGISMFLYDDQDPAAFNASVTNSPGGEIWGNRFGVILSYGGSVANEGFIMGYRGGGVLIQATAPGRTGSVTNASGAQIWGGVSFYGLDSASIDNSGAIDGINATQYVAGVHSWNPLTLTNNAGGTITGTSSGIIGDGASLTLNNTGSIRGMGTTFTFRAADAGVLITGGPAAITNSGAISGAGFGITTGTYSDPDTNVLSSRAIGSTVTNSGEITGDSNDGVRLIGGGTVTNSGYIGGRVGAVSDGVSMFAFEDQDTTSLPQIGTVNNLAGGLIEGHRLGIILSGGGTINNAGTINGGTNGAIVVQTGFIGGKTGAVTNSGTINGAITFNELASAAVTNSGRISDYVAFNDTTSATLTNSGRISASVNDAIRSTSRLSLTNSSTGAITGAATGIYDHGPGLTVDNAGTIRGIGDTGIAADGGPLSITNSGTIQGGYWGILGASFSIPGSTVNNSGSILGDTGVAVELYGGGSVTNSGLIAGVIGIDQALTGSVTNLAGGVIRGPYTAVSLSGGGTLTNAGTISGNVVLGSNTSSTVTNSGAINGYVSMGSTANSLVNSGSIITSGGQAVFLGGTASLVNSGTINGGTGTAVTFGAFGDVVTLLTGSSISGAVDGGGGTDTLRLSGTIATPTTQQTVGRFLNFETLNVLGGYWTAPVNTGTFTSTTINGGALAVDGTLNSPVTVNAGAMLAGTGTITGAVTLNSGGLLAPGGSSIGTLSITGNVGFNAGSTLSIQTNPNGTSDKLAVTGAVTITKGTTLQVLAGIANYAPNTSYVVVNASGGISGKFDTVTTDYAYFKATVNTQQKGTITVQIAPNGKPLPSAATPTTSSAAMAIDLLGNSSPLYQAVLYQSLTGARQAFTALSGSAYSRLDGLLADGSGRMELALDADNDKSAGLNWSGIQALASQSLSSGSFMRRGQLSLMMVGGRYVTRLATDSIDADVATRFFATGLAYRSGRFQGLASVGGAWHDVAVGRTIAFPGFAARTQSHYAEQTTRIDLESSYALSRGAFGAAPYAGYSRIMSSSPAFGESGALAALTFQSNNATVDQLRAGIRLRGSFALAGVRVAPHLDASVQRSWNNMLAGRGARFSMGGNRFDSIGAGFDERMASVDAGADMQAGPMTLTASYRGQLGNRWREQSAMVRAALRF